MYSVSAGLVKLSLLFQYLRILKEGRMRYACIALMVISSMWAFAYSFMALVPCLPVKAYWDWTIQDAKCYGYGVKAKHPFVEVFVSHAAINVLLDVAIVVVPVPFLLRKAMVRILGRTHACCSRHVSDFGSGQRESSIPSGWIAIISLRKAFDSNALRLGLTIFAFAALAEQAK